MWIGEIRKMTRADMEVVAKPRVARLRDSHHRIARLAAAGLRGFEIAERTGYSANRVAQLLGSPAMVELVAKYRGKVDEAFERNQDEYFALATKNMLMAERQISDRLEDAEEGLSEVSLRELALVSRDAADRFGYGKRQTNVNLNADFAAELEKAIARSGKVIELPKRAKG